MSDLEAEGELSVARLALDDGEHAHAASHVVTAIARVPGTAVLRAAGAVLDDVSPGAIPPADLAGMFLRLASLVDAVPDTVDPEALDGLVRFVRRSAAAFPAEGALLGAASAVLRRVGPADEAVSLASAGARVEPGLLTEMFHANALRTAGRLDDALVAMRRSSAHDPAYMPVHADIATLLAEMGRLDEAIDHAEQASVRDPDYDCIVYTLGQLRFQRDEDAAHLVRLADFASQQPDDSPCNHDELAACCWGRPWLAHVPYAAEAVVNALAQVLEQGDAAGLTRLTVSDLEVPSALATVRHAAPGCAIVVSAISEPDIRHTVRATGRALWTYDGDRATPAVPAPDPAVARAVANVASVHLGTPVVAYDRAVALAGTPVEELVRAAVHAPASGDVLLARAAQVFACLGILHQHTDEPWAGSARRTALVEIAYGQEDWLTEAAVYALVVAAWVDPAVRADVVELVGFRFLDAVTTGQSRVVTIRESLAHLALATPGAHPDVAALAREVLAAAAAPASAQAAAPAPAKRRRRWFRRG